MQFGASAPAGAATSGPRVGDGVGLYRHESARPGAGITVPPVGTTPGAPEGGASTCSVYWPVLPSPTSNMSIWTRLPASAEVISVRYTRLVDAVWFIQMDSSPVWWTVVAVAPCTRRAKLL